MKTYTYVLALTFLFPLFLAAQKSSYLSADLGITASENHYADNSFSGYLTDNYWWLNDLSIHKANYNVSINYEREVLIKLYVKIGIEMASHGYKLEKVTDLRWPIEHDEMGGYIANPDYVHEYTPKINVVNFLVPVGIRYEFTRGKLRPYVEGGIAAGILGYETYNRPSETSVDLQYSKNWQQFVAFANLAVGINYQLSDNAFLFVQPHAQWTVYDFQEGDPNELFYSFGLRTGARLAM